MSSRRCLPWSLGVVVGAMIGCGGDAGPGEVKDSLARPDVPDTTFPVLDTDAPPTDTQVAPDEGSPIDTPPTSETHAETDGATPSLPPDAWQAVALPACDGLAPGSEDCHYRLLWRPAACGGSACSRLMVYWSGGDQSCKDGVFDPLLEKWADSGVVVACAQPFTTSDEAGRYPYVDELERMDRLTRTIRAHTGPAWDGRYLVIAGVSHGATAPVAAIAKARAFETRAATWTGRDGTAVILFDGLSDPARLEAWAGLQGDPACDLWHARWVGRYGGGQQLAHRCDSGACFCAGGGARWHEDTTVVGQTASRDFPASPYVCEDFGSRAQRVEWRIVSCGGGQAEPCGARGDIIPDDQQTRLSDALATCPDIAVTYADHPGCAHALCGSWDFCGGERARQWLTSLGW